MSRTVTSARSDAATGQPVVALRGELWQRHVRLQDMDPDRPEYDDAVTEVLGLTADLLGAEAEAAEQRRAARRRTGRILSHLAAAVLVVVIVVVALLAPAVAGWPARWLYATALVVAVALAISVFRQRRARVHGPTPEATRSALVPPAAEQPEPESDQPPAEPEPGSGREEARDG